MKRKRHSPEQIIARLREAEAGLSTGQTIGYRHLSEEPTPTTAFASRRVRRPARSGQRGPLLVTNAGR